MTDCYYYYYYYYYLALLKPVGTKARRHWKKMTQIITGCNRLAGYECALE